MKTCQPCRKRFATWSGFVRHLGNEHKVSREALWRRANQVGDRPCIAVRSIGGRWALMIQDGLGL